MCVEKRTEENGKDKRGQLVFKLNSVFHRFFQLKRAEMCLYFRVFSCFISFFSLGHDYVIISISSCLL